MQNITPQLEAEVQQVLQRMSQPEAGETARNDIRFLLEKSGEQIPLPTEIGPLIREILANVAVGNKVQVISSQVELTTQQAADILNVSRPYVVKLMDEGVLKGHKVGTHRRLYASDVQEFQRKSEMEQRAAADKLIAISQELDLYE